MTDTCSFRGPLADLFDPLLHTSALAGLLLHPDLALPVAPATDRAVWGSEAGLDEATLRPLHRRAHSEAGRPWPVPLASAAVRRHRDGNRTQYEDLEFSRRQRLTRAVIAAAIDDGADAAAFLDEAVDGLWQVCEQSTWCWPAHDDTFERHGAVLATVTDPYLDLGAGEVAAQLAWTDQVLGPLLDRHWPGVRARLRHEVRVRVIDPFMARRDWHWIGLDGNPHNWNPWIHGNVLVAALRLLDGPLDAELRARVVALVIDGLDRYAASLPDDGAIDEGFHYWWNGAGRLAEALDLLAHATDGRLDALGRLPALRQSVRFPHRMHLGGSWHLNVADGPARGSSDASWGVLFRAARRTGDHDAREHAAAHRAAGIPVTTEHDGLGRLLLSLTDREWAAARGRSPLPRDVWLPSVSLRLAREHAGTPAGLTLTVKGGHNDEHHNHNDVGSFTVASDGVPVLVDAGRPTYTAATFGPDRYILWPMQSAWHNVPEVRSVQQPHAREAAAQVRETWGDGDAAGLSLDLTYAYPRSGLETWTRTATLERGRAARVVITDEYRLSAWDTTLGDEPATVVRMLAAGTVTLHAGGAVVVPLDGATPVRIRWPEEVPALLEVRELDDPMLSDVWGSRLTRIELDVSARTGVAVVVEQLHRANGGAA